MSSAGEPKIGLTGKIPASLAIVASSWHKEICDRLVFCAEKTAKEIGIKEINLLKVPGAMEIPLVTKRAIDTKKYSVVVALGVVVKGDTPHFEQVCNYVNNGLLEVSLTTDTPIGNGILTVNKVEQAWQRAGFTDSVEDKGKQACLAAVASYQIISDL